jgi:lipopolysaccharide export system permease protein
MHNEMTAMKAAGLPIKTIVRPILFLAFLIGVFVFVVNEWVVPPSYTKAHELLDVYIEKNKTLKELRIYKNLTYNSGDRLLIYFRKFSAKKNVAVDAVVLKWDESRQNTYEKTMARQAHFNGTSWDFYDVTFYQTDSQGKLVGKPKNFPKVAHPEITIRPDDLIQDAKDPIKMSIFDLHHMIQKMHAKGINTSDTRVQFYQRLALPWQSFLMVFFTLPILGTVRSRKALAGMVLQCLAIIFAYHVLGAVFTALGKSGKIWPILGAWSHHIAFFTFMLFQLDRANHE